MTFIEPDESVVDFGCGDRYLAQHHVFTLSVDKEKELSPSVVCDLDKERPDVRGDVAVMSGLLEWLEDPIAMIDWVFLNGRFKRAIFTYGMVRGDPRWKFKTTIPEILCLLLKLFRTITLVPWEGQYIFIVE